MQSQAQEYYQQWQQQDGEYKKMMDAKLRMEQRLVTIKQEREHLKELMKLAEAKKVANKAVKSLNDLKGIGDDDIRRLGDSIRSRLDEEDARMEYNSSRLQDGMDQAIENSAVDNQLEERRKRLGLAGSDAGTPATQTKSDTTSGGLSG